MLQRYNRLISEIEGYNKVILCADEQIAPHYNLIEKLSERPLANRGKIEQAEEKIREIRNDIALNKTRRDVLVTKVQDLLDGHPRAFLDVDQYKEKLARALDIKMESEDVNEVDASVQTIKELEQSVAVVPQRYQHLRGRKILPLSPKKGRFRYQISARLSQTLNEIERFEYFKLVDGKLVYNFVPTEKALRNYSLKSLKYLFETNFHFDIEKVKILEDFVLRNLSTCEVNELAAKRLEFWCNSKDLRGHLTHHLCTRHYIEVKLSIYRHIAKRHKRETSS